jgi:hypothetical protein
VHHDEDGRRTGHHDGGAHQPQAAHRRDRRGAEVVGDESDGGRPGHPACHVPQKEPPPIHPCDTGRKCAGDPKHRDEAREEDALTSVGPEEALGGRQNTVGIPRQRTPSLEKRPSASEADPVADAVAHDGRPGCNRDD